MPYSLEVHFDNVTNATIENMWKKISQNKNYACATTFLE